MLYNLSDNRRERCMPAHVARGTRAMRSRLQPLGRLWHLMMLCTSSPANCYWQKSNSNLKINKSGKKILNLLLLSFRFLLLLLWSLLPSRKMPALYLDKTCLEKAGSLSNYGLLSKLWVKNNNKQLWSNTFTFCFVFDWSPLFPALHHGKIVWSEGRYLKLSLPTFRP